MKLLSSLSSLSGLARLALVLSLAMLVPACGAGGSSSSGGGGGGVPPGPITLLSDDFSGILSANWVNVSPAGASATSGDADTIGSPTHGNPTPGLWLQGAGLADPPVTGAKVRSVNAYSTVELTVGVDLRWDAGSGAANYLTFSLDTLAGAPRAAAFILPTSVTFVLYSGAQVLQVVRAFPADTVFHRYQFRVDSAGNAEWRRDGALQQSCTLFPSIDVNLRATGPGTTAGVVGSGHVDNVLVTVP